MDAVCLIISCSRPLGAEFALDAQPDSRNEAFSLVAGLAGAEPDHGTWRLVLRFHDDAYGHVELDQLVFGYYPRAGVGHLGEQAAGHGSGAARGRAQLYGCHLRRLWDDAGAESAGSPAPAIITSASSCRIPRRRPTAPNPNTRRC